MYSDNFTQGKQAYWQESGQTDEYGVKITTNTESSGRYHSDWLSMIYSRLLLARQLLTDDGVIFVSIDDNEVHNLRKVMDEVFGEENFVGEFVVMSTPNARDYGHIGKMHEYVVCYSKDINLTTTNLIEDENKTFKYSDEISPYNIHPLYNSNVAFTNQNRPNLYYPFYVDIQNVSKDGFYKISLTKNNENIEILPPKSQKDGVQFVWRWGKELSQKNINQEIMGYKTGDGEFRIVQKMRTDSKLLRSILTGAEFSSRKGTAEFDEIFGGKIFSFPKPVSLIKSILQIGSNPNSLILDFFAGSGTTGQAVMELNEADGGNRQCILVQMPELTDERSEAYKAGYKRISDITIERNKRVIQGYGKTPKALIAGFEVFRLEQSNFPVNQWRPDPELDDDQNVVEFEKYVLAKEASLFIDLDPTKVILEIVIKEGLKLDYTQTILKDFTTNQVLQLSDDSRTILVCVDPKVELATVELLAKNYKESKFVCLERAIDTTTKWNLNHNLGTGFKAV